MKQGSKKNEKDDWNFVDISTLIKNVIGIRQNLECSFLKRRDLYQYAKNKRNSPIRKSFHNFV